MILRRLKLTALFLFSMLLVGAISSQKANAEIIAFWDFNTPFDFPDESLQIIHDASIGNGTLYQQRADTDGNGKGGVAFSDPASGIDVIDGRSIAWDDIAKNGDNDAEIFVEISTLGFTNLEVRFDLRGNGDGTDEINRYDLDVDLNPLVDISVSFDNGNRTGTIKDFAVADPTSILNNREINANGSTFITESIDLSSHTELNNQTTVALRFDDFQENSSMRIDNLLITGVTAIPEPTSAAFLVALSVMPLIRRRR